MSSARSRSRFAAARRTFARSNGAVRRHTVGALRGRGVRDVDLFGRHRGYLGDDVTEVGGVEDLDDAVAISRPSAPEEVGDET